MSGPNPATSRNAVDDRWSCAHHAHTGGTHVVARWTDRLGADLDPRPTAP